MKTEQSDSPTRSLIKAFKKSWSYTLCVYFQLNVDQITSAEMNEDGDIIINGNLYKLDVANYTGNSERYIFFNPTNGRVVVETLGKQRVYKLEVDLLDD